MTRPHSSVNTINNVFAELGLPDADNHYLKAQIVAALYRHSTKLKLTQAKTGALLGISQPEVSRMFKGHFREYSIERLIGFLIAFGFDVEIIAKSRRDGESETRGRIAFGTQKSKRLTG